jgi:predicted SAM-dependent methyltransferase
MRIAAFTSPESRWLKIVPLRSRARLRFNLPPPGQRRLELGSGQHPTPGYIHVDVDPNAWHVDLVCPADRVPLPTEWADEILSIHMLEHLPPVNLKEALRRWHGLLRPGGTLTIHTPNGEALSRAVCSPPDSTSFWLAQSAIYGYGPGPGQCTAPEHLGKRGDHRLLFTFSALGQLLSDAGFEEVEDVSGRDPCYHAEAWKSAVPSLCLEVVATKPV